MLALPSIFSESELGARCLENCLGIGTHFGPGRGAGQCLERSKSSLDVFDLVVARRSEPKLSGNLAHGKLGWILGA